MNPKTADDLYSRQRLARELGVDSPLLFRWQKEGKIPAPSIAVWKRYFYTSQEVETVKRLVAERQVLGLVGKKTN